MWRGGKEVKKFTKGNSEVIKGLVLKLEGMNGVFYLFILASDVV